MTIAPGAHALTIGTSEIRQHDGLFSLNDLHAASGGDANQRPNQFLRNEQTRALVAEIQNAQICAFQTRRGVHGGTYACRELVIAYAAWISPAFHLKVLRVFLETSAQNKRRARREPRQIPLLPAPRKIRQRDDLSFTKRDAKGRLINWFVPDRTNNWHEHYGIGEIWFSEIVELARHDPKEAYDALRFAGPEMVRYLHYGHEAGFFNSMARWVIAGILANPAEPSLPFPLPHLGIPPREGMAFFMTSVS